MMQKRMLLVGSALVFFSLALIATPAQADKESDFKKALRAVGCKIIPYSSEQSKCRRYQDQVNKYCKKKPTSCDDVKTGDKKFKNKIKERIDNLKRCIDHREEVKDVFGDVKSKLGRESAKKIKPLAKKLIAKIKDGERGHGQAIRDAENAKKACERKR